MKKKQQAKRNPYLVGSIVWLALTIVFIIALLLSITQINETDIGFEEYRKKTYALSHYSTETLSDGRETIFIYPVQQEEPLIINPEQLEQLDVSQLDAIKYNDVFEAYVYMVEEIGYVVYGLEYEGTTLLSLEDYLEDSPLKNICITASIALTVICAGVFIFYISKFLDKMNKPVRKK
ncbi:MAG: hypothetical protein IJY24_07135 [Clostridia bacterium]|nr:hypothetical protein [Clostridia bacterium]